jgi:hypothetical protein
VEKYGTAGHATDENTGRKDYKRFFVLRRNERDMMKNVY